MIEQEIRKVRASRIYYVVIISFFLAVLIRCLYGWDLYFWLDEAQSVYNINQGLGYCLGIKSDGMVIDVHPPLFLVILHFWSRLFSTPFGMRCLSILFGALSFFMMSKLTAMISTRQVGILAAILAMFSVPHIHYSVELRMYSMTLFLSLTNMWFFLKWTEDKNKWHAMGYIGSATLCLYTYHFLIFLFVAQWIYLFLLCWQKKHILKTWLLMNVVILFLYVPGFYRLIKQLGFVGADYWGVKPNLLEIPGLFFWFVADTNWNNNIFLQILILSTWLLALFFGFLFSPISRQKTILLLLWIGLPPLIIFFISFRAPLFQPRYFLFTIPVFYIFVSQGLIHLWKTRIRWSFIFAFSLAAVTALVIFLRHPNSIDMKSVIETLNQHAARNSPVFHVVSGGKSYETYIVSRYYRSQEHNDWALGDYMNVSNEVRPILDRGEFITSIDEVIQSGESFWLVSEKSFLANLDDRNVTQSYLPSGYSILDEYSFYMVDLYYCGVTDS